MDKICVSYAHNEYFDTLCTRLRTSSSNIFWARWPGRPKGTSRWISAGALFL